MNMENIIMNMVKVHSNHQESLEIFVLCQQSAAVMRQVVMTLDAKSLLKLVPHGL